MDTSPLGLARNSIPNIPHLIWTVLSSAVGKSPNSDHQDPVTEFIVNAARPIMQTPAPLLKAQRNCNYDYGVWGRIWVSKYTIPVNPEPEKLNSRYDVQIQQQQQQQHQQPSPMAIREAVGFAIQELDNRPVGSPPCPIPDLIDVETEWTGHRSSASYISPRPFFLSEAEMYTEMMKEVDPNGPTILYFHGGAHCLMDPSTHRIITSNLARQSRGRILAVRYRLAPQSIFPAALLDAFSAYLALISPPPGSFHTAVTPDKIVFAGDSSGGGLAASLALLLLTLSRHNISVKWHNTNIHIPTLSFAGLALTSPYLDVTRSLPSTRHNIKWDIIAAPPLDAASPPFPPDSIWPTNPPRAETYCTADMVLHPLVSPVTASKDLWKGMPPVYVNVGWEGFVDEVEVWCRRVAEAETISKGDDKVVDGQETLRNVVIFGGYQGMPHCFSVIPWNLAGRTAFSNWARFCSDIISSTSLSLDEKSSTDPPPQQRKPKSKATWTSTKTNTINEFQVSELGNKGNQSGYTREEDLSDDLVDKLWQKGREWRIDLEEKMQREWKEKNEAVV